MNKEIVKLLKMLFPASSIYHNVAPIETTYPIVVYSTLVNVPSRRADNKTYGSRLVYRITIIDDKEFNDEELIDVFENAGWLWENTNIIVDKNVNDVDEVYTSIDVSYLLRK